MCNEKLLVTSVYSLKLIQLYSCLLKCDNYVKGFVVTKAKSTVSVLVDKNQCSPCQKLFRIKENNANVLSLI